MRYPKASQAPHRRILALSVALGLAAISGGAMAQSTVGAVYGTADPGAQVELVNLGSGQTRDVTVGTDGKFSLSSLQPGDYKITATEKGQSTTRTVQVVAGTGFNLNLVAASNTASSAENLGAVTVNANALPPIDVSSPQTTTVLTAQQLKQLPIARNQTAVALLSPGANRGDAAFGNLASFSGASVAENSYYVNGFNVTNLFQSLTYGQVPFEAIDQQEVQEGGYGAEYGNSTGGVISVNTKRGTNEWKGGADVYWNPSSLQATQPTVYLQNGNLSQVNSKNRNFLIGNSNTGGPTDFSSRWNAWLGGPLIKDKLFIFALVSGTKTNDDSYGGYVPPGGPDNSGGFAHTSEKDPYWLVKLDWNINDKNVLEYTGFNDTRRKTQDVYRDNFDDDNNPYHTAYQGQVYNKDGGQTNILKYTSYITDDFTLTGQYGKSTNYRINRAITADGTVENYNGNIADAINSPGCPVVSDQRNPVNAGVISPYTSCNFVPGGSLDTPSGKDTRSAGRIDFEYKIGDHDLTAGWARDRWTTETGTAYEGGSLWYYLPQADDSGASPADNYAEQLVFATGAKVGITQKSYYLQDNWHVMDNLLVRLGIRNDAFDNQNGIGQTYVKQTHDWQPRLGFSWDVHGDSSLKIYGSAGDYSLPMDANVALRGAAASLYTLQDFSYTGVDPKTGAPTGTSPLSPLQYLNNEAGYVPNPSSVASKDLKPFKQREFILGAEQQVADWTLGAKAIYRKVLTGLDDFCDFRPIAKAANAQYGLNLPTDAGTPIGPDGNPLIGAPGAGMPGCFIFNPGSQVTLNLPLDGTGKLYNVHMSADDLGIPKYKRSYEALEFTAERNFDDVWYLKASYVWARLRGNSEGLIDSDNGQADTGTTQNFDYPELMIGSNGYLPNDRKHTVKVYGAWQISKEWLLGANGIFQTGRPENCVGVNPIDTTDGIGYRNAYFYCDGEVVPRGSVGRTETTWNIDMNVQYKPDWFKGFSVQLSVFNIFNKQRIVSVNETGESASGSSVKDTTYLIPTGFQSPRYAQLMAEYDFSL
jgi:hypothetical protein